ncbi:Phosphoserine phosphatase 1 [subsurface metagenome]
MAKILLVRHAQTKLHQADRFWGSTDIALSDIGIRQSEQLRDRLAEEKISAVYTSTLSRARTTADIIVAKRKINTTASDELNECNFGYIEGMTFDEIQRLYPELAAELLDWKTVAFPGGESLEDLDKRVLSFMDRLTGHKEKETVLIVSHGGPLRLLICHLLGLGLEHWLRFRVEHASLSIVETYKQGNVLTLLNDTSHLKNRR